MNNMIYVDSQAVILLGGGQTAEITLDYNEDTDQFEVTADCDGWIDDYLDYLHEYFPDASPNQELIDDAEESCKEISGKYDTLREINEKLNRTCEYGSYYDFTWEYEDGTPVE